MSKRPLSSWIADQRVFSAVQVRALLLELATRLEIVELERFEDIGDTLETLCTCSERGPDQEYEEVCPQYRSNT